MEGQHHQKESTSFWTASTQQRTAVSTSQSIFAIIVVCNRPADEFGGRGPITVNGQTKTYGFVVIDPNLQSLSIWASDAAREMGHGYGLLHSRSQDTPTQDYYDCWDIMSDRTCVYSFSSQTFGFGGPGLNAFSVAALGWLGSDRIQGLTRAQISNTANLVLAALNNPGTSGPRMITVPLADDNPNHYYTIEFRQARGWDREIKGQRSPHRHSSVLIHEIRPDGYSDLVTTQGGADRLPGPHAFHDPANNVAIRVTNLDEVIGVASIVVSNDYNEPPGPPPPTRCNQVAGNVAGFICDMSSYTVTLERQQTDQSWLTVNVDNAPRYTYPQVDDPAPPHGVDTYQICNRDSTGSEGCTAPIVLTNPVSFGSLGGGWR